MRLSLPLKKTDSFDGLWLEEYQTGIQSIAEGCYADSELLLTLISKLKLKTGKQRWWASFQVALKEVLLEGEIKQLKERIVERQRVMVLHVANASR